ncbi:helix-turn-helix domain-containing protein [Myceligenerans crystallogenes]|uniref:HTH cro/C1-type domain-containing protein n=1 Tax=Myceligenerans crystallogenes TaxID=316335 RepID=A0ABN2NP57_9MICO
MARRVHTYSPATRHAVAVLGAQIAAARRARRWTAAELAERAGISTFTLRNVEKGEPTVAIGICFELATMLAIPLFGVPATELAAVRSAAESRLAVLPASVREKGERVDDDF